MARAARRQPSRKPRADDENRVTAALAEIERLSRSDISDTEVFEAAAARAGELLKFERFDIVAVDLVRDVWTHIFVRGTDVAGRGEGNVVALPGTLTEAVVKSASTLALGPEPYDVLKGRFPGSHLGAGLPNRSSISVPLSSVRTRGV